MISLTEALAVVEADNNHRVLRRLPEIDSLIPLGTETRRGFYVDCETTGLDTSVDEIIEFGGIPFRFTLDGSMIEAIGKVHCYNEPRKAITEEITSLTGITAEMVAGKALDLETIEAHLDATDLVIAHNSDYDRKMLERYSKKFEDKHWGCSMSQVPWGTATRKLEYLLSTIGYFYEAHNAVSDCQAGLFAISQPLGLLEYLQRQPTEGEIKSAAGMGFRTGLADILDASRAKCYRVWALDAPYDKTGKLQAIFKAQGYRWNNGDDGRAKAWNKELHGTDTDALEKAADTEEVWLKANTFPKSIRFDRITAKERFTKRG